MGMVLIYTPICLPSFHERRPTLCRLRPAEDLAVAYVVKTAGGSLILRAAYGVDDSSLSWRQELAAREHMMDHGQLGPPTPATVLSPAESRRPSMHEPKSRRSSLGEHFEPIKRRLSTGEHVTVSLSRRNSGVGSFSGSRPRRSSLLALEGAAMLGRGLSDSLSMSAVEMDDESEEETSPDPKQTPKDEKPLTVSLTNGGYAHPKDLAAELHSNPKLAALRSQIGGLSMTPLQTTNIRPMSPMFPPILVNPKCSGYFVEPVGFK